MTKNKNVNYKYKYGKSSFNEKNVCVDKFIKNTTTYLFLVLLPKTIISQTFFDC
jgi:hypothetical protein